MVAGLFLFSILQYGQWIPSYYLPTRMAKGTLVQFGQSVAGNLFSPSRGLFITTTFLGPILIWAIARFRQLEFKQIVIVSLIWFAILVPWVGRFGHWWGGYCFGNRLLIDALPPLFLISTAIVRDIGSFSGRLRKVSIIFILTIAALFSVWLNLSQGLYNPASKNWCQVQDIDKNPECFWKWSEAQWLADLDMIAAKSWQNERASRITIPAY